MDIDLQQAGYPPPGCWSFLKFGHFALGRHDTAAIHRIDAFHERFNIPAIAIEHRAPYHLCPAGGRPHRR